MTAARVEESHRRRLTPDAAEERRVQDCARRLETAAQKRLDALGIPGRAALQGSVAKGTYLPGAADLDLFLILQPAVPAERLETLAWDVAEAILTEPRTKYAQHPYAMGRWEDVRVDIVPAYAVDKPSAKMSAVDRTPFHTAWMRQHLDDALRADVRLAKAFLKATGCYGAQTATGGFSGYLVEVLLCHVRSFAAFVDLLAQARPPRIALGPDHVQDDVSPWVVVDPVDPGRNCAAAVQAATLQRARDAARAYLAQPADRFFVKHVPPPCSPEAAQTALTGKAFAFLLWRAASDRLDIVYPQFQRAGRSLRQKAEDAGFVVARDDTACNEESQEVALVMVAGPERLPETRLHRGPVDDGRPNAKRFRAKHEVNPLRAGPVTVSPDGHLEVTLRNHPVSLAEVLSSALASQEMGRHITEAEVLVVTDRPDQVPPAWRRFVCDLVHARQPWEDAPWITS